MLSKQFALLAPLPGVARGHGGAYNYTINGIDYAGNYPWLLDEDQPESIQRRWYYDPILAIDHPYMSCNRGNPLQLKPPSLHAPVTAGTNVSVSYIPPVCPPNFWQPKEASVKWTNETDPPGPCRGPDYDWPHALGPMFVYMAACNGPCENFQPEGKKVWFKIYEEGFTPGFDVWNHGRTERDIGSGAGWGQGKLRDSLWNVTIPTWLKPGNYLIRHEVLMLEIEPTQFYPECAQLTVMGEGDRFPSEDYLVPFPGGYKADEVGIAITGYLTTYEGHNTRNYTIPGPKLWTDGNE